MSDRMIARFGFWESPITAELVAGKSIRLGEPVIEGDTLYWLETRPDEGGRNVLVRLELDGSLPESPIPSWDIRTRVHEYGGGAYAVSDRAVYFSEPRTGQVYEFRDDRLPIALTPEGPWRYADFEVDCPRGRVIAVCEDHSESEGEPNNSIVEIDTQRRGAPAGELVSGSDFYSNPRLSPNGERMCWLEWTHPNMPWDGTELWVGKFDAQGQPIDRQRVAGGPRESIFQPQWSPDGVLHFVSDRSGYWNLYRHAEGRSTPIYEHEAEFGLPQWVFGMSTYGFTDDGRLLSSFCEEGTWKLGLLGSQGEFEPVELPYTQIEAIAVRGNRAVMRAASPTKAPALLLLNIPSRQLMTLARSTSDSGHLRDWFSVPQSVSIPSGDGESVHAFYYPCASREYAGPDGEKPPLIIRVHGGPTAAASNALSLTTQYWTSRGFTVLDLNYRGSTGFGRAYRERLSGKWGIVDVDDTVAAARHFVNLGLADRNRIIVKGGSAGGYTALCCLAFRDDFAAGASYYGIGDLKGLARDTHKFESRYLETLVGPWPSAKHLYEERSPLGAADQLSVPTVFFQGAEDKVVPKAQTEAMVEALQARGVPVAYHLFEGEAHGFRDGDNIKAALEAELEFYRSML